MTAVAKKKKGKTPKVVAKKKVEKQAPVEKPVITRSYGRDEVESGEVVGLFADEIQAAYSLFHQTLDRENAEDKAMSLLRDLRYGGEGARITNHEFDVPLCKRHKEE